MNLPHNPVAWGLVLLIQNLQQISLAFDPTLRSESNSDTNTSLTVDSLVWRLQFGVLSSLGIPPSVPLIGAILGLTLIAIILIVSSCKSSWSKPNLEAILSKVIVHESKASSRFFGLLSMIVIFFVGQIAFFRFEGILLSSLKCPSPEPGNNRTCYDSIHVVMIVVSLVSLGMLYTLSNFTESIFEQSNPFSKISTARLVPSSKFLAFLRKHLIQIAFLVDQGGNNRGILLAAVLVVNLLALAQLLLAIPYYTVWYHRFEVTLCLFRVISYLTAILKRSSENQLSFVSELSGLFAILVILSYAAWAFIDSRSENLLYKGAGSIKDKLQFR